MKYAIIIADGAADLPMDELDGRTPLEAARTPNMDALAQMGRLGTAATTPPGLTAGSDICTMDLLGYDPRKYHTGRAPLEAAAMGLPMGPSDWVFRVNLVTVGADDPRENDGGAMIDHSAGAISDAEARELFEAVLAYWRACEPELTRAISLTHGVSYRSAMIDGCGADFGGVRTIGPHEMPGRPWREGLPIGLRPTGVKAAEGLVRLVERSREVLAGHAVNAARRARGQREASLAWPWGQGTRPMMPSFESRFGLRGAMITAVDLLAGIANLIGWQRLNVPGVTSYHDTDYAAQGRATAEALGRFDIVCCHVEAPDEASHQGDLATKIAAIEAIDEKVVGPVMAALAKFGDAERDAKAVGWRMMVLPDHATLVSTRRHDPTPVPVAMAGAYVRGHRTGPYCERSAAEADLHIAEGHELMEFFLFGGRPAARGR